MAGRRQATSTTTPAKHGQGGRRPRAVSGRGSTKPTDSTSTLPMLRTSERGAMKRCEFQWYVDYELRARFGTPAPALRFGTLVHQALAGWYIKGVKRGVNPVRNFIKLYDRDVKQNESRFGWRLADDEPWQEARDIGRGMLTAYLEEYGNDPDWEVLATEHPFKVLVRKPDAYTKARGGELVEGEPWFWYTGVVDGVWKHKRKKELWIPDHKTTASLSDSKLNYLQMDDQAGAYWSWGVDALVNSGYLGTQDDLRGMMYNFMRKGLPDERPSRMVNGKLLFLNKDGSISKVQPAPLFKRIPIFRDEPDREMAKLRSKNDFTRLEMLRDGRLTIGKTPGMFTCPGCPARDACELHEVGQDWEGFIAQTTHKWDPYAEHEIYAGDTK